MPEPFIAWNIAVDRLGGTDPSVTPIVSIAAARFDPQPETFTLSPELAVEHAETDAFFAHCGTANEGEEGSPDFTHSNSIGSETLLLSSFDRWLSISGVGCRHLVGWGSSTFDAPFAHRRSGYVGSKLDLWLRYNPTLIAGNMDTISDHAGGFDHAWGSLRSLDLAQEVLSESVYADMGIEFALGPVAAHHGFVPEEPNGALAVVRATAAVALASGIGDRTKVRS